MKIIDIVRYVVRIPFLIVALFPVLLICLIDFAFCGSSWDQIACIDRLVELGEIVEIPRNCWTQYKVYTEPKVHNL